MKHSTVFEVLCGLSFLIMLHVASAVRTLDQLTDKELKGQKIPASYTAADGYTEHTEAEIKDITREESNKNLLVLKLKTGGSIALVATVSIVPKPNSPAGTFEVLANSIKFKTPTLAFMFRAKDLADLVQKIASKDAPPQAATTTTNKS